jgi:hypothetical protein
MEFLMLKSNCEIAPTSNSIGAVKETGEALEFVSPALKDKLKKNYVKIYL